MPLGFQPILIISKQNLFLWPIVWGKVCPPLNLMWGHLRLSQIWNLELILVFQKITIQYPPNIKFIKSSLKQFSVKKIP